jgi:cobalt/nickel transport system permease protein
VGAVLAARPDLVVGAADLDATQLERDRIVGARPFAIGGALTAIVLAMVVSQFASGDPDGLEKVAAETGFIDSAERHALADTLFADYATRGIDNAELSLAIAGLAGVVLTLFVGYGLVSASTLPRRSGPA